METLDDVESIISNPNLLKNKLVDLGSSRFGISKSRLNGLNKSGIIEAIKAGINHERSLNIIGEQAKKAGENRSN